MSRGDRNSSDDEGESHFLRELEERGVVAKSQSGSKD